MGNRLSQISTRQGDSGDTGLADQSRIGKDTLRIQAMGDVDELNSFLGLLCCESLLTEQVKLIQHIQDQLFNVGAELSMPGHQLLKANSLAILDHALLTMNGALSPLKEFILPGGSRAAALAHVCRTIARRAERSCVALSRQSKSDSQIVPYLNRLSDLLFVLARLLNVQANLNDVYWQSERLAQTG